MNENQFKCNLPAGRNNDYNLAEIGFPCIMTTNDVGVKLATTIKPTEPSWARFLMLLRQTVLKDRRTVFIDGEAMTANINWVRDHIHELKAFIHWERDLKSYLGFLIKNQHKDGFFYEMTVVGDNFHLKFVAEYFTKRFPEDHLGILRLQNEADIEYLMVEGATEVYKATGDDAWIKEMLPYLEKGIDYMTSHPDRWDEEHQLCKRPFTIDTWDFTYGYGGEDRNIHPETPMSIMHGDNSGVYQAMTQLAWINRRFGNEKKAVSWEKRAKDLRSNLDKYCFNGKFYTHQVHLGHNGADGADETKILSLSNTYDINRGVTTQAQAESIIEEYMSRRETENTFAEWFSINPPYENFKGGNGNTHEANSYINGGITSFTAGELSKAAFNHGFEEYGWDILCRLRDLSFETGEIYFLYDPITKANIAGGPSGWGSAAILSAFDQGLAGIVDEDVCYRKMSFSPRWAVTNLNEIHYITGYEASNRLVETLYHRYDNEMLYELRTPSEEVNCHIMLPIGKKCLKVIVNDEEIVYSKSKIRNTDYVDFTVIPKSAVKRASGWDKVNPILIRVAME